VCRSVGCHPVRSSFSPAARSSLAGLDRLLRARRVTPKLGIGSRAGPQGIRLVLGRGLPIAASRLPETIKRRARS